jgi:hypothetical protein
MDRKEFFKKTCFTGVCLCGFGSVSMMANDEKPSAQDANKQLNQDWLSNILSNLNTDLDEDVLRNIIKKSAIVHYNNLKMDDLLSSYIGDLEKFNKYIEGTWGWKIDYNKTTNVLIADENKEYCVCPVLEYKKGINSSAICYCSEGFAEKMFSTVTGVPVTAKVISSIRKGDKSCKYRIEMPQ